MLAHPAVFAHVVEGRNFFRDLLEESRYDEKKMKSERREMDLPLSLAHPVLGSNCLGA